MQGGDYFTNNTGCGKEYRAFAGGNPGNISGSGRISPDNITYPKEFCNKGIPGVQEYIRSFPDLDNPAFPHYRDPVGNCKDIIEMMGDLDDGSAGEPLYAG
jgi:hypothetical protein